MTAIVPVRYKHRYRDIRELFAKVTQPEDVPWQPTPKPVSFTSTRALQALQPLTPSQRALLREPLTPAYERRLLQATASRLLQLGLISPGGITFQYARSRRAPGMELCALTIRHLMFNSRVVRGALPDVLGDTHELLHLGHDPRLAWTKAGVLCEMTTSFLAYACALRWLGHVSKPKDWIYLNYGDGRTFSLLPLYRFLRRRGERASFQKWLISMHRMHGTTFDKLNALLERTVPLTAQAYVRQRTSALWRCQRQDVHIADCVHTFTDALLLVLGADYAKLGAPRNAELARLFGSYASGRELRNRTLEAASKFF